MKIFFYNDPQQAFGGAESYWHDTAFFLRAAGVAVHQFSFKQPTSKVSAFFSKKHSIEQFLRAIEHFEPDIVHLNKNLLFAASIHKALKSIRVPVVSTVHDYHTIPFATNTRNRFKLWVYPFRRCATTHIIPSLTYFNHLKNNNISDIHHIPHFIHSGEWAFNSRYNVHGKKLLYVGRLEKQKGIWTLLDALRILLKKDTGIHLSVIGQGNEAARIRRFVARQRLDSYVTLVGEKPRHELLHDFHCSTLLVMPSLKDEMFGLAGLEAQASGLPVLASNLSGIREWCRHAESGWMVRPGDAAILATEIEYLLERPDLRETIRYQARQQVIAGFPPETSIQALIGLYRQLSGADINKMQIAPTLLHSCSPAVASKSDKIIL
jgi:glycosyltransferase involved in cell wall biosynthesis